MIDCLLFYYKCAEYLQVWLDTLKDIHTLLLLAV